MIESGVLVCICDDLAQLHCNGDLEGKAMEFGKVKVRDLENYPRNFHTLKQKVYKSF